MRRWVRACADGPDRPHAGRVAWRGVVGKAIRSSWVFEISVVTGGLFFFFGQVSFIKLDLGLGVC